MWHSGAWPGDLLAGRHETYRASGVLRGRVTDHRLELHVLADQRLEVDIEAIGLRLAEIEDHREAAARHALGVLNVCPVDVVGRGVDR